MSDGRRNANTHWLTHLTHAASSSVKRKEKLKLAPSMVPTRWLAAVALAPALVVPRLG